MSTVATAAAAAEPQDSRRETAVDPLSPENRITDPETEKTYRDHFRHPALLRIGWRCRICNLPCCYLGAFARWGCRFHPGLVGTRYGLVDDPSDPPRYSCCGGSPDSKGCVPCDHTPDLLSFGSKHRLIFDRELYDFFGKEEVARFVPEAYGTMRHGRSKRTVQVLWMYDRKKEKKLLARR